MTNEELAGRILEERKRRAQRQTNRKEQPPYYMLNIGHPAVAAVYSEWRSKKAPHGCPPSDLERTLFELDMMSPLARKLLEQHFDTIDRLRGLSERGARQ